MPFNNIDERKTVQNKIKQVQRKAIQKGLKVKLIKQFNYICNGETIRCENFYLKVIITTVGTLLSIICINLGVQYIINTRCLIPLNHFVWEVTRPLADCGYCINVTKPAILWNVTRQSFQIHSYSSKPIIVKNAINRWRALNDFSYYMFKKLYETTAGSYESLEDGCQYLNFKSDLFTLKEVFDMPDNRVRNEPGQKPWYVGWGNCHPEILNKVRKYYDIPDFLPEDSEFPATENIFFGYEIGAVMHLDYISRLMWQGQVKGVKNWVIAPVPECEHCCHKVQFYVESGDIVLLDTRLWYHSTNIPKGQFSITVQSEYG